MASERRKILPALWTLFAGSLQLVAVIATVIGTIYVSNFMKANQPSRVAIDASVFVPVVQTHIVETRTRTIPLQKTGSVEPSVYVSITPGVSGVVASVTPGLGGGAVFAAEENLFRISPVDLEIEVQRREADLASARASLEIEQAQGENARREWESFGRGEISELAARGPQIRQAEAQVLTAQASLSVALLDLERSGFAFPFSGRVVDLSLALGQKLTEGQSYGTVYSFDNVEVSVSLSTDELALLDPVIGTTATIEAQVLGRSVTMTGDISRVAGEVNRATRLTNLIITLDPDEVRRLQLQPGTFVRITLAGPELLDVAEVPNAALQDGEQIWLIEDGVLRRTQMVRTVLRGREKSLVTGLHDGARIVIGTVAGASDGMSVRIDARDERPNPVEVTQRPSPSPDAEVSR